MAMRSVLVLLHRWFGLATALFLFVAGATGAVISWDHELDAWLNPQLYHARSGALAARQAPLSGIALAERVEAADPQIRVTYLPLVAEPGRTLLMSVEGRIDPATGEPAQLGFNQVALDPATGQVQGRRMWGEAALSRENLLPFLYKLHYTMQIPDAGAVQIGIWLMGIVGVVWMFDCFVALWLSFPNRRSWRKSFAFRWQAGGHRLHFDLHRSGGVWIWALLLMLAVTSVSMNLNTQLMRPLVAQFSRLTPSAFDTRTPRPPTQPVDAGIDRRRALQLATQEAARRGWQEPAGAVFYSSSLGIYGVGFFRPGREHGDGGLGNAWLYVDGTNGAPAGNSIPGTGSAGDIFLQAQFPLHSGRIIGLAGRVLISFIGVMVAMLSVTGIVIWLRKRGARSEIKTACRARR
jgi:uncharacterized iron-regulated membrane protein